MKERVLSLSKYRVRLPAHREFLYAVDSVDLELHRGEILCLVGESGSGKSVTALSLMRLLDQAEYGLDSQARLDEDDLLERSEISLQKLRGKKIAIIFQEPMTSLNPVKSIGKQLNEVATGGKTQILKLLSDVGIGDPEHVYQSYPHQLSGGMRQRVMIAMALAGEPDVLIADEPTTALDVTIQAQVLSLIQKIGRERQMGLMLITHDLALVSSIADTVAVMYAGHIVEQASREVFFSGPKHPYSQGLLSCLPQTVPQGKSLRVIPGSLPVYKSSARGCRFADRCEYAWDLCHEQTPELLTQKNSEVRCHLYTSPNKPKPEIDPDQFPALPKTHETTQEPNLVVNHLSVAFPIKRGVFKRTVGHIHAVREISFKLHPGRTLALVGESGCGKTTTALALLRLISHAKGEVKYDQDNLLRLSEKQLRAIRKSIQMIFQDPMGSLNPRMTVRDILSEGWDAQDMYHDTKDREDQLKELIHSVGLPENSLDRYPHEFSGGQHQRIAIARSIGMQAKIIVCDEPTSALDVSVQAQILRLLQELQAKYDLTYLFITHNLPVVAYLAHEVAVMYLGVIVETGSVKEIMNSPKHPYTQALLACVPQLTVKGQNLYSLQGEIPSPAHPPSGCHFHPRCPYAMPQCKVNYPVTSSISKTHQVRCYLYPENTHEEN